MTMALFDDGTRWADLSEDGVYRYELGRRWDAGPVMGLVMLNPSIADAELDDATIRKVTKFARREGLAGLRVVNLFAWRGRRPADLVSAWRAGVDVVGPANDRAIERLVRDRFTVRATVAAWGAGPGGRPFTVHMADRIRTVLAAFDRHGVPLLRFDDIRDLPTPPPVAPHPLYLPDDTPITAYPRSST